MPTSVPRLTPKAPLLSRLALSLQVLAHNVIAFAANKYFHRTHTRQTEGHLTDRGNE